MRWVIGSFGVCLCIGLCEGANPKCANVGRLKLFFKMCGGKIFKTLRWFECRQTGQVGVELQRNSQQSIGRPKVCLEVKSLVVLVSVLRLHGHLLGLLITVSGLAKVAIFTTNVDAENQTLINHKCVCGALNRHFCQTAVRRMCFFFCRVCHHIIVNK